MRELWALIKKEFIQIRRDPRTLGIIIFAPLVMLFLYGYAVNFDIRHIKIIICDQDGSQASRDLIAGLSSSEYFEIKGYTSEPESLITYLDRGQAKAILWIPPRFGRNLAAKQKQEIFLGLDASDANTATIAAGYLNAYLSNYSNRIILDRLAKTGSKRLLKEPFTISERVWYNPELKSSHFIVPGLIAILLMMLVSLLTAMAITGEKERNTFEQLAASPMHSWQIILGKILPYTVLSFAGVILVITAGIFLFGVPLRGSLLVLFGFVILFLLAALGIGLLISATAKSQQQAMLLVVSVTVLPAVLLSGFIFPIASMPWLLQLLSNLVPAKFFLIALRGIFLKGVGLETLWPQGLALLLFTTILLVLASIKFHKRLD